MDAETSTSDRLAKRLEVASGIAARNEDDHFIDEHYLPCSGEWSARGVDEIQAPTGADLSHLGHRFRRLDEIASIESIPSRLVTEELLRESKTCIVPLSGDHAGRCFNLPTTKYVDPDFDIAIRCAASIALIRSQDADYLCAMLNHRASQFSLLLQAQGSLSRPIITVNLLKRFEIPWASEVERRPWRQEANRRLEVVDDALLVVDDLHAELESIRDEIAGNPVGPRSHLVLEPGLSPLQPVAERLKELGDLAGAQTQLELARAAKPPHVLALQYERLQSAGNSDERRRLLALRTAELVTMVGAVQVFSVLRHIDEHEAGQLFREAMRFKDSATLEPAFGSWCELLTGGLKCLMTWSFEHRWESTLRFLSADRKQVNALLGAIVPARNDDGHLQPGVAAAARHSADQALARLDRLRELLPFVDASIWRSYRSEVELHGPSVTLGAYDLNGVFAEPRQFRETASMSDPRVNLASKGQRYVHWRTPSGVSLPLSPWFVLHEHGEEEGRLKIWMFSRMRNGTLQYQHLFSESRSKLDLGAMSEEIASLRSKRS